MQVFVLFIGAILGFILKLMSMYGVSDWEVGRYYALNVSFLYYELSQIVKSYFARTGHLY